MEDSLEKNYKDIITIESGKRSGQPCIRGMRITVADVLSYLASGMTQEKITEEYPELTKIDIEAVLWYAAKSETGKRYLIHAAS